jgi:hypothetical protein
MALRHTGVAVSFTIAATYRGIHFWAYAGSIFNGFTMISRLVLVAGGE